MNMPFSIYLGNFGVKRGLAYINEELNSSGMFDQYILSLKASHVF
jgi:hypothetical protein